MAPGNSVDARLTPDVGGVLIDVARHFMPLSQLRESIGPRLVAMVREVEAAWRTRPGPRLAPPEYHTP